MARQDVESRPAIDGLFTLLRELRTRAGLTQQQIAEVTGAGGVHGRKLIARLEAGHVPNPSITLILDYLRACKATPEDVAGFLSGYLGSPMPIPSRPVRGPRIPKPASEDLALLALRREAAWWNLRKVVEVMLHHELNGLGVKPMSRERKVAAEYGRKVFRILYRTRVLRPALRERRLKRCRAWADRMAAPADVVDHLTRVVTELFADMETKGELDWLPPADQARHLMLLSPRHRLRTDYDICRGEWLARMYSEEQAREAARKPVIEAALALLRSAGLTEHQVGNYRSFITAFLNVAETTQPGTAARERILHDIIGGHRRPYIDPGLVQRLRELVFTLRG